MGGGCGCVDVGALMDRRLGVCGSVCGSVPVCVRGCVCG